MWGWRLRYGSELRDVDSRTVHDADSGRLDQALCPDGRLVILVLHYQATMRMTKRRSVCRKSHRPKDAGPGTVRGVNET